MATRPCLTTLWVEAWSKAYVRGTLRFPNLLHAYHTCILPASCCPFISSGFVADYLLGHVYCSLTICYHCDVSRTVPRTRRLIQSSSTLATCTHTSSCLNQRKAIRVSELPKRAHESPWYERVQKRERRSSCARQRHEAHAGKEVATPTKHGEIRDERRLNPLHSILELGRRRSRRRSR